MLADTDVLIDHLRGHRRLPAAVSSYSVITRTELFAGRATEEDRIGTLLEPLEEIPVDRAVAERAGRLRRTTAVRTPDALIAATALEHGLPLMTRNARDFAPIADLQVIDPATG